MKRVCTLCVEYLHVLIEYRGISQRGSDKSVRRYRYRCQEISLARFQIVLRILSVLAGLRVRTRSRERNDTAENYVQFVTLPVIAFTTANLRALTC